MPEDRAEHNAEGYRKTAAAAVGVSGFVLVVGAIVAAIGWIVWQLIKQGTLPAIIAAVAVVGVAMFVAGLAIDPEESI